MTLREGRFIEASDTANAPRVVVINEALARRYFQGQDPIGRRICQTGNPWYTVAGVVGNLKGFGVGGDPMPSMYFSRQQEYWGGGVCVLVRTAVPPSSMAGVVRKEIRSWNKNIVIGKLAPAEDLLAESVMVPRFYMLLVLAFAVLALTLAAVGLYGLLNYSVAHRTHEIGVRMALGAERGDVLAMILKQGLTLILTGVVLGLAGAWASTRALESLLFQVHPRDAATFGGACLVLIVVGLLACYIPARRATQGRSDGGAAARIGAPGSTGVEERMKEPYGEGLASHTDPESCMVSREAGREALTGAHAGGVLSREMTGNQDADAVYSAGRQHWWARYRERSLDLRGQRPPACMEPPRARTGRPYQCPTRSWERAGRGR